MFRSQWCLCIALLIGAWTNSYAQGSDAYWDETFFGSANVGGQVYAILPCQDSIVFVGGEFQSTAVEVGTANNIARYANGSWKRLDLGLNNTVRALSVQGNNLYAGGLFDSAGGASAVGIAKYDLSTSSWSALGNGLHGQALSIASSDTNLYVGGGFDTAGTVSAHSIARWDGHSWSALGNGINGLVYAVLVVDSNVYIGGDFDSAGTVAAKNIAKWNGTSWSSMGSGMNKLVRALAYDGSSLIVGGDFDSAGSIPARHIASWNGSWSSVGTGGSNGTNNSVTTLAYSTNNNLYVGGDFDSAGSASASHIAQYSSGSWSSLGSGIDAAALGIGTKGDSIFVGGLFQVAGNKRSSYLGKWQYVNVPKVHRENDPSQNVATTLYDNTYIPIKIAEGTKVKLTLLDEKKEMVSTVLEKTYTVGSHLFQWLPEDLAPGQYTLQAEFNGTKQSWTFTIHP